MVFYSCCSVPNYVNVVYSRLVSDFFFSFIFTLSEMGTRIEDLEKNVAELMTQAGIEEQAGSK
uniref:Heat shock factor-binding protein 1-like n=1 Tax=Scophthalmus maximus TaxID=52904 RepID=A0A8D3BG19_SCOMX